MRKRVTLSFQFEWMHVKNFFMLARTYLNACMNSLHSVGLHDRQKFTKLNFIYFIDLKVEGTIKLVISNLSQLRHKVTTSFHTIAAMPW